MRFTGITLKGWKRLLADGKVTRPLEVQYMLFLKTTPNYPETGLTRINPS